MGERVIDDVIGRRLCACARAQTKEKRAQSEGSLRAFVVVIDR
jgi:hypothetical protein